MKLEFLTKAFPPTKSRRIFGLALLGPEDEGTPIFLNVKRYTIQHHNPQGSNLTDTNFHEKLFKNS